MESLKFEGNDDARNQSWAEVAALMGRLFEAGQVVEFRCIRGREVVHRWVNTETLSDLHAELMALNDDGFNIYYGCSPRTAVGGTKASDVETANALFIDMDGGTTPDALSAAVKDAGLPKPTVVITTGGGCQAIWRLKEAIPVAEWCARQRAINAVVAGADATICDAPRILRAPGFRNRKPERGPAFPMATTVVFGRNTYNLDAFPEGVVAFTPPTTADGQPAPVCIDTTGLLPAWVTAFLERGELLPPKGKEVPSRRETAYRAAIELCAAGIDQAEATERICRQLEALGLEEDAVADVKARQIRNAYSEPRTPTIDADRLPTAIASPLPARPEITIADAGGGRVRVHLKRGIRSHVDVLDPAKAAARRRFLNAAGEALGDGTDVGAIDDALKSVAVGESDAVPTPDAEPAGGITRDSFIPVSNIIRPEAFMAAVGDEWTAGITVPKFRDSAEDGVEGVWLTFINRHDGTREAIELPTRVTVADEVFFVHPAIGGPIVQGDVLGWSEASQWQWLDDGKATVKPADLVREIADTFGQFLHLPDDVRDGTLNTLAVWTILTYQSHTFDVVPYLAVTGVKGTGKSRLMYCLQQLAFRSHVVANPTAAVLFRHIHTQGGTVLVDEAEHLEQMDAGSGLSQTLLTSNTRGAAVPRCDGDDNKPVGFTVFGPKGFFSINTPSDTLADRAIHFKMFRAPPGYVAGSRHPKNHRFRKMWQRLRDGLHTMVLAHAADFADMPEADSVTPRDMFPRTRETWGPILQLAAVLEQLGATGLLASLQAFATDKAQVSEVATVPEEHEHILRALVTLQTVGKPTTSGDVLSRAYVEGLDAKSDLTAVKVGLILANYNLKHGAGRKRRHWSIMADQVATIETNYGLALRDGDTTEKSCDGGTPVNLSHLAHLSPTDEKPLKNSGFERDRLGDRLPGVTGYCQVADTAGATRSSAPDLAPTCHQTQPVTQPVTPKPPENAGETEGVTGVTGGDRFQGVPPTQLFSKPGKVVM